MVRALVHRLRFSLSGVAIGWCVALAFNCSVARGDHYSGATISYTCLGGNFYTVNLDLYLNCAGVPIGPQTLRFHNQCGVFFSQNNVAQTLNEEVSPLCPSQLNSSTCNGGLQPGFRRHRFSTTVYLSPCNYWTMSWNICCRNVTENLQNTPGIFASATLNNLGGVCDNSPRFADNGVPFLCVNAPISYNPGASDPNGNTMVFELIPARLDSANEVLYRAPYTGAQPIPGIYINPVSGQLDFSVPVAGNYVVVIKVSTYNSAGQLIGTVMRDLMFVLRVCDGSPPVANDISNITGVAASGPSSVAVCSGQSFCVDMVVSDANPAAVITMTTNASTLLPGSTFVVTGTNPAVGRLCWTANLSLLPANIYIESGDGECPIENVASRSIYVNSCLLLPVELVSFQAHEMQAKVLLEWATALEVGTDHFVVERSTEGTIFHALGQVRAVGGGPAVNQYDWVDDDPLSGTTYYRLLTVDEDGTREHSETIAVDRGEHPFIQATNLGGGIWSVNGVRAGDRWRAFDLLGRDLPAQSDASGTIRIQSDPALTGFILFTVERGDGTEVLKLPASSSTGDTWVSHP